MQYVCCRDDRICVGKRGMGRGSGTSPKSGHGRVSSAYDSVSLAIDGTLRLQRPVAPLASTRVVPR
ncbi:hypothetical protein SAMN05216551_107192 [Chitinasiproducens palmae]|uniref:Uncharacterized protein n=1 Tax=Chitinasiproducens palmae TaxID=1770053 RepID=A0A1H2PR07_9BURK|nr:hypothetical protein SAMN05216551_107192 [Chitinasiproducens palmae]